MEQELEKTVGGEMSHPVSPSHPEVSLGSDESQITNGVIIKVVKIHQKHDCRLLGFFFPSAFSYAFKKASH